MNNSLRSTWFSLAIVWLCVATCLANPPEEILPRAGVAGGLIVHLGCGDGKLTAALYANQGCLVQGLDTDAENIEQARATIRSKGLYGKVSAAVFDGRRLPYIDNLVNLVVADDLGAVPMDEVFRVLAPLGVAMIDGQRTVKPWPSDIDQWQQYLHDADNNAVAEDTVVGPPRHLQWATEPVWSRSHMSIPTLTSMVSSNGRLFTIEDTATPENPFLPGRFALVARGAFNGVVLWKHAFPDWEPITRYVKDVAIQSQRRLAAIGDTVYCTPGLSAPVTAFDAATGKVLRCYQGTQQTEEFAYAAGMLYLVVGDRMNAARYDIVKTYSGKGTSLGGSDPEAPFDGAGFRGAYAPESLDRENPTCRIVAIEADSGRHRWETGRIRNYVGCTLAIQGTHAVYQTNQGLVCLNSNTGTPIWDVEKPIAGGDGTQANTLILTGDAVYATEGNTLHAYSLDHGREKWTGPIANNYEKSADLFFVHGSVWIGGAKQPTRLDPETGQPLDSFQQAMNGPMGHDRCYRNFITQRYYINSKTGGADFLTLDEGREFPNHWLRGTCGLGVLPCNGLLYAPPYSCQCSIGAMLQDLNAVYTEKGLETPGQPIRIKRAVRLVKGPAYGKLEPSRRRLPASSLRPEEDWPAYRHDPTRGGFTPCKVPAKLSPRWTAKVTTIPSAPVVAEDKVFVADVDAHTLRAFDFASGNQQWDFVAGGRIDSPPAYDAGLVLFGSADGWVYCLRAADGALVWKFKDLPEKMICAFGQVESAWPVSGSVLVQDGIAYFAAGRSSFLDGGIFLYGLDPRTGKVVHQRGIYGPFESQTGFPKTGGKDAEGGFKNDIFVSDGNLLYLRHKAFHADLSDAGAAGVHLIPSAGFIDRNPQHRTYWTIAGGFAGVTRIRSGQAQGDILVTDGKTFYEVRGFPVHRHSYFDPRLRGGYNLLAGAVETHNASAAPRRRSGGKGTKRNAASPLAKWSSRIPLTGKAMAMAGDVLFVAGTPAYFPSDPSAKKYEAAYAGELGGILWAASATNGEKLAEYRLDAPPRWDGMAAAGGRLFVSLTDGHVVCFGE